MIHPVQVKSVRRDLHHHMRYAAFDHPPQKSLDVKRLRCCHRVRVGECAESVIDGPDDTHLEACGDKYRFNQI